MKQNIKIRNGVFETNSSSSHSLSLGTEKGKDFVFDTLYPDMDGVVTIELGEYGWDWFKTNDAYEKACYAATDLQNGNLKMLTEVIQEVTGCAEVKYVGKGYVDHESEGTTPRDRNGLKDFIFNKNSWLFGGNDNTTYPKTMYHVPVFTEDGKKIKPKYKYKLSIPVLLIAGKSDKIKLLENFTKEDVSDSISLLLNNISFDKYKTPMYGYIGDYYAFSGLEEDVNLDKKTFKVVKESIYSTIKDKYPDYYEKGIKERQEIYDEERELNSMNVPFEIDEI